jgi:hypothetical protein
MKGRSRLPLRGGSQNCSDRGIGFGVGTLARASKAVWERPSRQRRAVFPLPGATSAPDVQRAVDSLVADDTLVPCILLPVPQVGGCDG